MTPPLPDPQHTSPLFPAAQVAKEEAGDDAGDEDGNQRAFTDALDAPDFHIGETDVDDRYTKQIMMGITF